MSAQQRIEYIITLHRKLNPQLQVIDPDTVMLRGITISRLCQYDSPGYQRVKRWYEGKVKQLEGQLLNTKPMYDKQKVEDATKLLIEGLGKDITKNPHLAETPQRVAKMWEILLNDTKDPNDYIKLFPNNQHYQNPIEEKNLTFHSFCAHHMLPFYGKAAIAYIPDQTIIGLSKLPRILRHFAKDLQVQEDLTNQVATFLFNSELHPRGVAIIIDSGHMCMSQRGVRSHGAQTRTFCRLGDYQDDKVFDRFERWVDSSNKEIFGY